MSNEQGAKSSASIICSFMYHLKKIIIKLSKLFLQLIKFVIFSISLSCLFDLLPPILTLLNFDYNLICFFSTSSDLIFLDFNIIKKSQFINSVSINEIIEIYIFSGTLKMYIKFWKLTLCNFSISPVLSVTSL